MAKYEYKFRGDFHTALSHLNSGILGGSSASTICIRGGSSGMMTLLTI